MVSLARIMMMGFWCTNNCTSPKIHGWMTRSLSSTSAVIHGPNTPQNVGIVGGGLAGLSTAFHLLQKAPTISVTIIDKEEFPGMGGASAIAGGLLHPLSPKGKLAHLGLEGLVATNQLLQAASEHNTNVVLRDHIYRIAVNEDNVSTLKTTSRLLPNFTTWIPRVDLPWEPPSTVLGALQLHSGCKVVHMPSYLQGLWEAIKGHGTGEKNWVSVDPLLSNGFSWIQTLAQFDTVVLCAGSGLFHDSILDHSNVFLPVQIVRGQSVELTINPATTLNHAMLCGKYVSPLLDENKVLIGATHEFSEDPMDEDKVLEELRDGTFSFASDIWENAEMNRMTTGFRVQSNRGHHGRMPIVGTIETPHHDNAWIFTGLSSRGLLYHGVFGEILASKILGTSGTYFEKDTDWWQKKK